MFVAINLFNKSYTLIRDNLGTILEIDDTYFKNLIDEKTWVSPASRSTNQMSVCDFNSILEKYSYLIYVHYNSYIIIINLNYDPMFICDELILNYHNILHEPEELTMVVTQAKIEVRDKTITEILK